MVQDQAADRAGCGAGFGGSGPRPQPVCLAVLLPPGAHVLSGTHSAGTGDGDLGSPERGDAGAGSLPGFELVVGSPNRCLVVLDLHLAATVLHPTRSVWPWNRVVDVISRLAGPGVRGVVHFLLRV